MVMHKGIMEKSAGWLIFPVNETELGRIFAIAGVAVAIVTLTKKYKCNEAQSHIIGGILRSISDDYSNFAFDPSVHSLAEQYTEAIMEDYSNGNTEEFYPIFCKSVMKSVATLNVDIASMNNEYFENTYKMVSIYADLLKDIISQTMQAREKQYNLIIQSTPSPL